MAAITNKRFPLMGSVAFVLCVLVQVSFSSAGVFEYEVSIKTPDLPSLPNLPWPPLSLPKLPNLGSLPPLPTKVTIPGFKFPGFSIPPQKPLEGLRNLPTLPLPTLPPQKVPLPAFPGINLPAKAIIPPLPGLKFPAFSLPPRPAETVTIPSFNPADLNIPGFTIPTVSIPPTSFPFPRRALPKSEIKN